MEKKSTTILTCQREKRFNFSFFFLTTCIKTRRVCNTRDTSLRGRREFDDNNVSRRRRLTDTITLRRWIYSAHAQRYPLWFSDKRTNIRRVRDEYTPVVFSIVSGGLGHQEFGSFPGEPLFKRIFLMAREQNICYF